MFSKDEMNSNFFLSFFAELQRGFKTSFMSDYDTGIGSTTTIGSPQPSRSQVKTNGCFTNHIQVFIKLDVHNIVIDIV